VDVAEPDFDAVAELNEAGIAVTEPNILTVRYTQITRNKRGELYTHEQRKNYRFAYNKGLIMPDFTVQSYGYMSE
jgi:hypothetical protein